MSRGWEASNLPQAFHLGAPSLPCVTAPKRHLRAVISKSGRSSPFVVLRSLVSVRFGGTPSPSGCDTRRVSPLQLIGVGSHLHYTGTFYQGLEKSATGATFQGDEPVVPCSPLIFLWDRHAPAGVDLSYSNNPRSAKTEEAQVAGRECKLWAQDAVQYRLVRTPNHWQGG